MATQSEIRARLEVLGGGASAEEVMAFFDALSPITIEAMIGRWRGREIPTGHAFSGLLATYGWYGKQFDDAENVHPLLFEDKSGEIFRVDPRRLPMGLAGHAPSKGGPAAFSALRGLLRTSKPKARLRMIEHRGQVSAAMIYDDIPVVDAFRRVDHDTLLGIMDQRGVAPFFFMLCRVAS